MMHVEIVADGLADAIGEPWSFRTAVDRDGAVLTTDHARSSYGQPVLARDGRAYGPADLPNVALRVPAREVSAAEVEQLRAAGWTVKPYRYCDWCGEPLSDPYGPTLHPQCQVR